MNNIEKAPEGGYYPSFYIIQLNTDESPKNFLKDEFFQTLVHEYVHFLQDLFTTYGMARSSNVYSLISKLYYCKVNELQLPINDYAKYFGEEEPTIINKKLFDLYGNRVSNEFYGVKINPLEFDDIKIIEDEQEVAGKIVTL